MIVVDTSILAYLYLPGDHTAQAETLLEHGEPWAAPVLWRSEFRNILAGYMRRGTLNFEHACNLQVEAESLLYGFEYNIKSSQVLALVRRSDCSAYDCEFIALAMELDTKLVTMDKKLLKAFPKYAFGMASA